MFDSIIPLFSDPAAWAALAALVVMEVVLGIDNLIFISIVTNKLPEAQRPKARQIGIGLALIMRLAMLSLLFVLVGVTAPLFNLGIEGAAGPNGSPTFETAFSVRDLILIAGGLFLVWKATSEIHSKIDPEPAGGVFNTQAQKSFAAALVQIILIDLVFSVDSILTAVGMTEHLPIMIVAVVIAVLVMFLAAGPVADFIHKNPTVVMLALAFLLMIGMVLIADGFGVHVPKGYIYAAMAFSVFVETLNVVSRRKSKPVSGSHPEST